jgi:hypothetical protein
LTAGVFVALTGGFAALVGVAAGTPDIQFEPVRTVTSYVALGLAGDTVYATARTRPNELWESRDAGASWTLAARFATGSGIRKLADCPQLGIRLLAVSEQGRYAIYSSPDGRAWRRASLAGQPFSLPAATTLLVNEGFACNSRFAFVGTYIPQATDHDQRVRVYRVALSGGGSLAFESLDAFDQGGALYGTFKHVHSLGSYPDDRSHPDRLYVYAGDKTGAVLASDDDGTTFRTVCSTAEPSDPRHLEKPCLPVDATLGGDGAIWYGHDNCCATNYVWRLDPESGETTRVTTLGRLPSYSIHRLASGLMLIGTTKESTQWAAPATVIQLFALDPSSGGLVEVLRHKVPEGFITGSYQMIVLGQLPSGEVVVNVAGAKAVIANVTTPADPPPPPPVTGAGESLLANGDLEADPSGIWETEGPGEFSWASDRSRSPSRSLKVVAGSTLARWTAMLPISPGLEVAGSAWMTSTGGTYRLALTFWDGSAFTGVAATTSGLGAGGWRHVTLAKTAPATADRVRVELRMKQGTAWTDDLAVSAAA